MSSPLDRYTRRRDWEDGLGENDSGDGPDDPDLDEDEIEERRAQEDADELDEERTATMNTATALPTDSRVIDALNTVLKLERTACEQFHDQEHFFHACKWPGLRKTWDKLTELARDRRREILDKIFELGGMPDVEWAEIRLATDVVDAFSFALDLMLAIHKQCIAAYEAVDETDDYVTIAMLIENQKAVEKLIRKLQGKLEQIEAVGLANWLAEMM